MGNNSTGVIPDNYQQFTHEQLAKGSLNKEKDRLEIFFHKGHEGQHYTHWKNTLNSLENKNKYLFLPQVQLCEDSLNVCCANDDFFTGESYAKAIYQPYIYTLDRQIKIRKQYNRQFREHEIWKLMKSGVLALRDWQAVFPNLIIGKISPLTVVMNYPGKIKLLNLFSFVQPDNKPLLWPYAAPEKRLNSVVKYSVGSNVGNQHTISSIYSLGVVLLQAISLQQAHYSDVSTSEKKKLLEDSNLYTLTLKKIILKMIQEDMNLRPNLYEMQTYLKDYASLAREN